MSKTNFANGAVYLLALANLVYAIGNGFDWIHYVAFGLAAAALALDVAVMLKRGKENNNG